MKEQITLLFEQIAKLFKWWVIILPWEQGLRIRLGKKKKRLCPGVYFRFPYFDTVVVRTTRLRAVPLSIQTIQTKDGHALSVFCSCGYAVGDIEKLYETLFHPDATISAMIMGFTADFIATHDLANINPKKIEESVMQKMNAEQYGLKDFRSNVLGFAAVKTFRLIQDSSWQPVDRKEDETDALR